MSDIRFNRWLHQSGTGGVYQDSSGRVGIGTSVPTSALDVQSGTITIGSNTLSSSGVSTFSSGIVVAAGSTTAPSITPTGDSNTGIFFPSADTIAFGEGGVEAVRIDSSGRVTKPYQPCFQASGNQGTTYTAQVVPFNVSLTNNGNYYSTSTYRFTAPVAGYYFFTLHAIMGPDGGNSAQLHIRRNGTIVATAHRNTHPSSFPWEQGACSAVVYLNVADYTECYIASGTIYLGTNITGGEIYSAFNGFLLG